MKTIILIVSVCAISMGAMAKGGGHSSSSGSNHYIVGHTTKNGTYVAPSHATNPNNTKLDSYSQKGNVNPYTGKEGTKN